jgi:hypothetical protein
MSKALSVDLRARAVEAVRAGATHREAAERFGVSAASVSRWQILKREQGDVRPKSLGGDRKSHRIDAHKDAINESPWPGSGPHDRGGAAGALGAGSGVQLRLAAALLQTTPHHAQKKTAHAAEQDRPDVVKRRQDWAEGQPDLVPDRLVFIDETWASTNMMRRHGRCHRGERLRGSVPHGHWKTTTFVAGLRITGLAAPFVLDRPINRVAFETYVEKVLVPELKPGDIVIMDNLSSHKGKGFAR